ncbi:DUF4342 domain-containing protein [Romboutsia sp.]|uniref:DUF4342 domain-containing protein n=1 Tax=Romboutsia sp. TaxID=1965302 RepID=UPI003F2FE622
MEMIQKIDEIRKRIPNVTYAEAKQALLDSEEDILAAIILLESKEVLGNKTKQAKKVVEDVLSKDGEEIKEFIKKCNVVRVIVEKNDRTIMNIPVTVGVVGLALGPLVTLTGLAIAVLGKCQIKIQNEEDGRVLDLGEFSEEKINIIKQALNNTAKEAKERVNHYKKDDKDITDELIKEEDIIDDQK